MHRLVAGTRLHRLHDASFPGDAFNPCRGGRQRFSPLFDAAGRCVPSLYAATTFDAAVYETIAHGVDLRDPFRHVRREALDDRCHSELVCAGELLLAPLFRPEVEALGHAHEALFAPRVSAYADCLDIAARLHAESPRAQGLIWSSVRDDGGFCVRLFGDRVAAGQLRLDGTRTATDAPELVEDVRRALERSRTPLLR